MSIKTLIMGAAGRDFHNFNTFFRDNSDYEVVAFTATQIPNIEGRVYPTELAESLYPEGVPIYPESDLLMLIEKHAVDQVVFAYSDVPHEVAMHKASAVLAAGADFVFMGTDKTQVASTKPVVSVCAVRTGCGKSQTTRRVSLILRDMGFKVAAIRHPMPYGDLAKQAVQRYGELADLERHECTIEEMEEYEPHIAAGNVIFAGADYAAILAEAEKEADVIIWDGGNNDTPFVKPDLWITILDPLRPGHEVTYFPGRWNLENADVVVINKAEEATPEDIATVRANIAKHNPKAVVFEGLSPVQIENADAVKGKRALVIEDGPTTTHGGMKYGAATIFAKRAGCEIVDREGARS